MTRVDCESTNCADVTELFDTAEITPFWSNVIDGIDVVLPTVVEVIVPATLITANEAFVNGIMVYLL
jgi:hypothetical protein